MARLLYQRNHSGDESAAAETSAAVDSGHTIHRRSGEDITTNPHADPVVARAIQTSAGPSLGRVVASAGAAIEQLS